MPVLVLDTATAMVSVAVLAAGECLAAAEVEAERAHGELLAPTVQGVLTRAGLHPRDLTAVAGGLGPGPFTSLRVGVVTAAALGHALGIPAYGIGSLDLLACTVIADLPPEGPFGVATDARRKEVYAGVNTAGGARLAGPAVLAPAAARELFERFGVVAVCGAGAGTRPEAVPAGVPHIGPAHPRAQAAWPLLAQRVESGAPSEHLHPDYLRRPDAQEPATTPKSA